MLFWQKKLLRFFQALVVDPEARDAEECYLNLQIRCEFGVHAEPLFKGPDCGRGAC